jgi:2-iminobutanoate/2-iminopropanoate deaminase
VYCAGQTGVDPETGSVRVGVEEQTRQALNNLSVVLQEVGSNLESVIQARVFLQDFGDFTAMDGVFQEFFDQHKPARTTVPCIGFPELVKVEIDAIAALEEPKT